MDAHRAVARFIATTFPSVWSLELLLQLRRSPARVFASAELVGLLRASEAVVTRALHSLAAAGLVLEEGPGMVRYAPASDDLDKRVGETEQLYKMKPDAVRRLIVRGSAEAAAAFADAFKLRGE